MHSIVRRVLPVLHSLRRGRVAIVAAAVTACAALTLTAYLSYQAGLADAAPTLEQLERRGRYVLAYDHNEDDLARMTDESAEPVFVAKPFSVTVVADGEEHVVACYRSHSVQDALNLAGVVVGPEDRMSHFPNYPVTSNERIVVERWTHETVTTEKTVPFDIEYIPTSLLYEGNQQLASEGQDGLVEQTFDCVLRDGVVMEHTLVSETVLEPPVNRRVLVGTPYAPVSPYDFAWEMDENGDPTGYEARLSSQRAAGYSARPGAGTACGWLPAAVGHVAVNPNVIPYGSKLYIRATNGGFVYGYAIAADTGTGLMQDIIDVDLFYETYDESVANGMREVEIFILEYPE